MRRVAVILVSAAAVTAACGGAGDDTPAPSPAPAKPAAAAGPSEAELVYRKKLLDEIKKGKYKCYCTAAERARERIEKGLVDDPFRGG